jgi:hypothetical protein
MTAYTRLSSGGIVAFELLFDDAVVPGRVLFEVSDDLGG